MEMYDLFLTLDSREGNWFLQAYSYNASSEVVPWALGINAGFQVGSYSAPAQKELDSDTIGRQNFSVK